jgi:hypothetical protein
LAINLLWPLDLRFNIEPSKTSTNQCYSKPSPKNNGALSSNLDAHNVAYAAHSAITFLALTGNEKKKSDKVDELLNAQRSGGSQKVLKPDQLDYIQFLYFLLL